MSLRRRASFLLSAMIMIVCASSARAACNLDIDGDGKTYAMTDGLLLLRSKLGITGTALTQGAIGPTATRRDELAIQNHIAANNFDFDGNNLQEAKTDGLLALRYLFGFRNAELISSAIGVTPKYTVAADIAGYIQSGCYQATDLPPNPGAAVNATLRGVDTNLNGVRDEVERALFASYAQSPNLFNEAMKAAKFAQSYLVAGTSSAIDAQARLIAEVARARCLRNAVGLKDGSTIAQEVELRTFNTAARRQARGAMLGTSSVLEILDTGTVSCD